MVRTLHSRRYLPYVLCPLIVTVSVGLFLYVGSKLKSYEFLMFHFTSKDLILDIMDDVYPPADSIFFIETTHILGEEEIIDAQINYRKACAVESTAKLNPNTSIYVLYTTPIKHPEPSVLDTKEYAALKEIYQLKNVKIRSMNVSRFIKDSPVEPLFSSGKFDTSTFPQVHLSDVLRLLVLWTYGGTYLDMDLVVTKKLRDLGKNFLVLESDEYDNKLNNAQMNLENKGIGREITDACLRDLVSSFDGLGWAENGPYLLSRVVSNVCHRNNSSIEFHNDCKGLRILSYWIFNPYSWDQYPLPFDSSHTEEGYEIVKRSYAIHVYSHSTDEIKIYKNQSFVVYAELAKQYCPGSYYNSGDYF